ncbi:MAG: Wzz/FepE/Etk N-terminal domain-containing protein [Patescibacteria group bacterium]
MSSTYLFNAKNIRTIITIGLLVMIASLAVSLLQTPKYKSSVKLLVVVNQENVDPYTASRTADYIANVLTEVVYTNSFIDNTFKSNFNLKDELGIGAETRLKNWKKAVQVKTEENKGIIFINVLNRDRDQANQFAQAISYTVMTKHQLYHGLGDRILIKMIDAPVASDKPDQPRTATNTVLGLVAGIVLGFTLIIIFPEQQLFESIFKPKIGRLKDETLELIEKNDQTDKPSLMQLNLNNEALSFMTAATENDIDPEVMDDGQGTTPRYYDW